MLYAVVCYSVVNYYYTNQSEQFSVKGKGMNNFVATEVGDLVTGTIRIFNVNFNKRTLEKINEK